MVGRGESSWEAQSTADQREMKAVVQLSKNAVAQGSFEAANNLGIIYSNGQGVKQDYAEAVKWWRKAAEQGYAEAQYNLGNMYAKGQGVKQNYAEAFKWFRRAAEQGIANAQCGLGALYASGNGVQKDISKALLWFEKAASQGYDDAKLALEKLRRMQATASSAADPPVGSSDAQGACAHCAAQSPSGIFLKSRSRCGIACCCSRDCQLSHWKAGHKKSCKVRQGK